MSSKPRKVEITFTQPTAENSSPIACVDSETGEPIDHVTMLKLVWRPDMQPQGVLVRPLFTVDGVPYVSGNEIATVKEAILVTAINGVGTAFPGAGEVTSEEDDHGR